MFSFGLVFDILVKHDTLFGNCRPVFHITILSNGFPFLLKMPGNSPVKPAHPEHIELLYDIYAPAMYGVITNIMDDKAEAEKTLNKIFCNLSSEFEKYDHRQSLFLWLMNLSRNHCISQLIEESKNTKAAPLHDYINRLPLFERTVFSLVYFKGFTTTKIAEILCLPASKIEPVYNKLPAFTPYLFPNIQKNPRVASDILQSLVENLIPDNDKARVEALKKYNILYTPAEEVFNNLTNQLARIYDTPMAFLSLVDEDTVFYKAQFGSFGKASVNRENSLCSLTILSKEPLIIEDASIESCFKDNPFVQAQNGIKFYAGVPLITKDGFHIGALCVVDTRLRKFSFKDTLLLVEYAEMAMQEIESRHLHFQELVFHEQVKEAGL